MLQEAKATTEADGVAAGAATGDGEEDDEWAQAGSGDGADDDWGDFSGAGADSNGGAGAAVDTEGGAGDEWSESAQARLAGAGEKIAEEARDKKGVGDSGVAMGHGTCGSGEQPDT